jgi:hypothetical protein
VELGGNVTAVIGDVRIENTAKRAEKEEEEEKGG